jgi:hypothetical protein
MTRDDQGSGGEENHRREDPECPAAEAHDGMTQGTDETVGTTICDRTTLVLRVPDRCIFVSANRPVRGPVDVYDGCLTFRPR